MVFSVNGWQWENLKVWIQFGHLMVVNFIAVMLNSIIYPTSNHPIFGDKLLWWETLRAHSFAPHSFGCLRLLLELPWSPWVVISLKQSRAFLTVEQFWKSLMLLLMWVKMANLNRLILLVFADIFYGSKSCDTKQRPPGIGFIYLIEFLDASCNSDVFRFLSRPLLLMILYVVVFMYTIFGFWPFLRIPLCLEYGAFIISLFVLYYECSCGKTTRSGRSWPWFRGQYGSWTTIWPCHRENCRGSSAGGLLGEIHDTLGCWLGSQPADAVGVLDWYRSQSGEQVKSVSEKWFSEGIRMWGSSLNPYSVRACRVDSQRYFGKDDPRV